MNNFFTKKQRTLEVALMGIKNTKMENKTKITNYFTEKDLDERSVIFIDKSMVNKVLKVLNYYAKKHNFKWRVEDAGTALMFAKN